MSRNPANDLPFCEKYDKIKETPVKNKTSELFYACIIKKIRLTAHI
jgi:hypothetical protein